MRKLDEMTEAEMIEFTASNFLTRLESKGYCWKCAEEFPMTELIEDDNPYIKDETDPNDKNYQCKPCADKDDAPGFLERLQ